MSFPRYPKYKESGVEWLGEVPEHWQLKPLYGSAVERYESNKGMVEDNLLSLSYGKIVQKDISANDGLLPESFETYQVVHPGDIVFRLTDLQNDKRSLRSALVEEKGIITSAYLAVTPRGLDSSFTSYLFRAYDVTKVFYSMGGGLRQSMKFADVKRMPTLIPPLDEQTRIAAFLDEETAKIDELVTEQQRLMELLNEKRQAVISHAVTKGLNPKVSMKPSGIEWLGDVPAHWEVKPLRYFGRCQNGLNIDGDAFGSGHPFVSYGDVYKNRVLPSSPSGLVESSEQDWERYSVERGDVFFTRTSETIDDIGIASICLSTIPKATFAGFLIRFRPEGALDCSFSKYYFSNPRIGVFFASEMNLVTRASLSQDLLKGLPVLLPPKMEQQEIGVYLDACIDIFEQLTAEAQRAIDLLQERRTALISAAVTGQIQVPKSI